MIPSRPHRPTLPVALGALRLAEAPDKLEIRGLGSCIALGLYDETSGIAGLAHVVLPRTMRPDLPGPAWSATDALPRLLAQMRDRGANQSRIVAHIAGGATLLMPAAGGINIGPENARAVEASLRDSGIPLLTRDVGGAGSRNVLLDPATGKFTVEARGPLRHLAVPSPPSRRAATAGEDAAQEIASMLLFRTVFPLSRFLQTPVEVQSPSAFRVEAEELAGFVGGPRTQLVWAVAPVAGARAVGGPTHLVLIVPELHARHVLQQILALGEGNGGDEADIATELFSTLVGHAAAGLGTLLRAPLVPRGIEVDRGDIGELLDSLGPALENAPLHVLHGRLLAGDVVQGVDLALLLVNTQRLPGIPLASR